MPEAWREKIQTSMIINRLTAHVKGEVELTPSQVTAGLGLLKKTAPDLQSTTLVGDENNPIKHAVEHSLRPTLTREEWLKFHGISKG